MTEKILIVTSRRPFSCTDADGGSMTVDNLWDSLHGIADVDFLVPDSYQGTYLEGDSSFYTYVIPRELEFKDWGKLKFQDRIQASRLVADRIRSLASFYDKIIVVHVFHAFGLCKLEDGPILNKMVIFPMFLTPSYLLCHEVVPPVYTELEMTVLNRVGKIITPSHFEREQLIGYYRVDPSKVIVIPRYVNDVFCTNSFRRSITPLSICYIASIKCQKRNDLALELLEAIKKKHDIRLYIVGSVFDEGLFERMISYLAEHNINEEVVFLHSLDQTELNDLYSRVFLNISVASCETFGRAIIEGLKSGLPAVVLKGITCFDLLIGEGNGVIYSESIEEMADIIVRLYNDRNEYDRLSQAAAVFGRRFSKESIQPSFIYELCR